MTTSHPSAAAPRWGVPPVQLGQRRVLHPGRLRWLRAPVLAGPALLPHRPRLGLPLQWATDHVAPADAPAQLAGLVGACVLALAAYGLTVRLGEGPTPGELALRRAPTELVTGGCWG
jgi:uncharacterized protein